MRSPNYANLLKTVKSKVNTCMKKELYEKIEKAGLLQEAELIELKEAVEPEAWVASMYGAPIPREKNINRVVAGLRAHMGAPQPIGFQPMPNAGGGVSERYVQALEMQIQALAKQVRQLHNQYNKLTKSHNVALDRINNLARHTKAE